MFGMAKIAPNKFSNSNQAIQRHPNVKENVIKILLILICHWVGSVFLWRSGQSFYPSELLLRVFCHPSTSPCSILIPFSASFRSEMNRKSFFFLLLVRSFVRSQLIHYNRLCLNNLSKLFRLPLRNNIKYKRR